MLTVSRVAAPTTPFPQRIIPTKPVLVKNYHKKFTIIPENIHLQNFRGRQKPSPTKLQHICYDLYSQQNQHDKDHRTDDLRAVFDIESCTQIVSGNREHSCQYA